MNLPQLSFESSQKSMAQNLKQAQQTQDGILGEKQIQPNSIVKSEINEKCKKSFLEMIGFSRDERHKNRQERHKENKRQYKAIMEQLRNRQMNRTTQSNNIFTSISLKSYDSVIKQNSTEMQSHTVFSKKNEQSAQLRPQLWFQSQSNQIPNYSSSKNILSTTCEIDTFSKMDPFLVKVNQELQEEHRRKKTVVMQQKFIERYHELVERESLWIQEKEKYEERIRELLEKQNYVKKLLEEARQENQAINIEIDKLWQQNQGSIKQLQQSHARQLCKKSEEIESLKSIIVKKDAQIAHLHTDCINKLQSHLQEQVEECLTLKSQVQKLTISLNAKTSELHSINTKYEQLIKTLQQNLELCQKEKNSLSEDLQRVSQQLQEKAQKQNILERQKKRLQVSLAIKEKQCARLNQEMAQLKQSRQNEVYDQKIKYLQQLRQKNSIIEQYEQAKQHNQRIMQQLNQLKQKVSSLSLKLLSKQQQLQSQRTLYLQKSQKEVKQLSLLREQNQSIKKQLESIKEQDQRTKNQLLTKIRQLSESLMKRQSDFADKCSIILSYEVQLKELRQFKLGKLQQLQSAKSSYSGIVLQLKSQLQKAKEIIKSKNQQINQGRNQVDLLRTQIRDLKCQICKLQNQANDSKQQAINLRTDMNDLINQKKKQFTQVIREKDLLIKELRQIIIIRDQSIVHKEEKQQNLLKQVQQLKRTVSELKEHIESKSNSIVQCTRVIQTLKNEMIANNHNYTELIRQKQEGQCKSFFQHQQQISKLNSQLASKQLFITELYQTLEQLQHQHKLLKQQSSSQAKTIALLQQLNQKLIQQNKQFQQKIGHIIEQNSQLQQKTSQVLQNSTKTRQQYFNEQKIVAQQAQRKSQETQRKYLKIIQQMRVQFMELTLQFKNKSKEELQYRILLENQNQLLKNINNPKIVKS